MIKVLLATCGDEPVSDAGMLGVFRVELLNAMMSMTEHACPLLRDDRSIQNLLASETTVPFRTCLLL